MNGAANNRLKNYAANPVSLSRDVMLSFKW